MLAHHVFFWLHQSGSDAHRRQLLEGIEKLKTISVVRSLHSGIPAATEERDVVDHSWDVCELLMFDSAEDQKAYQDHPVHQDFIKEYGHLWKKVVVYDSLSL